MTLEEMTAQRDALLAARYCGVRTVEMAGRRVTYATDAEMAAAITDLERRIEAVQEGARKRAVREARTRFVIEPALGSHIFEPDEFHWLRRHRVHAAKHIPHALRLDVAPRPSPTATSRKAGGSWVLARSIAEADACCTYRASACGELPTRD
jgi:hypothetical protein